MRTLLGIFLLNLAVLCFGQAASFNQYALTKFNDFSKTPANKESIHIGGRLDDRHIAYLAEAGYKSLLSVVVFSTNDTVYNGVEGLFPSTDYEMSLIQAQGMIGKFYASTFTVQAAQDISNIIDQLPKPLYIHCHVSSFIIVASFN
ncbi:hypothetical protein EON65_03320 [archaeon]|nr:MAG: hypothetical protein EON65_03320 [archaeon]